MTGQLHEQLNALSRALNLISPGQYTMPIYHLSGSTIGQHTRHCIEMIGCLVTGSSIGKIDYVNRERNLQFEQDLNDAKAHLNFMVSLLDVNDKPLLLSIDQATQLYQPTTYLREVHFLIEHTIHHLALIKVALIELGIEVPDENFGVGYSTRLYREANHISNIIAS